jgi:hypothetical protein
MAAILKQAYPVTQTRQLTGAVWPVLVDLDGDAYTLWGPAGGERDLLLTVGGELRAFRRWSDLVAFVLQNRPSNFSTAAGYVTLQEILAQPVRSAPDCLAHYPLGEVAVWLRRRRHEPWPLALDCMNLIWDAARTVGDRQVMRALERGGGPLSDLMDALAFADGAADLSGVDWPGASAVYDTARTRLRAAWRVDTRW